MDFMRGFPDKFFDLAVVDPPYGGGQHFNFRFGTGDLVYDSHKPSHQYFNEIMRVAKNQIVWGGNYFTDILPVSRAWISWSKSNPAKNFSDFELAWTSFDKVCMELRLDSYGFNHADKRATGESTIHPTQKPIALYDWIFKNYAKPSMKILDTHLGSGSSRIAAHKAGMQFWATELDADYFAEQEKRFADFLKNYGTTNANEAFKGQQLRMF
jgi:site-specific DNA-methyltransferase (adenine-specific)